MLQKSCDNRDFIWFLNFTVLTFSLILKRATAVFDFFTTQLCSKKVETIEISFDFSKLYFAFLLILKCKKDSYHAWKSLILLFLYWKCFKFFSFSSIFTVFSLFLTTKIRQENKLQSFMIILNSCFSGGVNFAYF